MDVPLFVGLVNRGTVEHPIPSHRPVPVESLEQFTQIFGEAVVLGWNSAFKRTESSWLPRAVRSFFDQGGRRCWVVGVPFKTGEVLPLERWVDEALVAATATDLPALSEAVRQQRPGLQLLRGIHAALTVAEPSLIAVPDLYHGRVRLAATAPELSGGVEPESTVEDRAEFGRCGRRLWSAPQLRLGDPIEDGDGLRLTWAHTDAEADACELQESTEDSFREPTRVYRGSELEVVLWGRAKRALRYRARSWGGGHVSDWSTVVSVPAVETAGMEVEPLDAARIAEILGVHRALLRICAARGDTVAVLSAPAAWRTEAVEHFVAAIPDPAAPAIPVGNNSILPLTYAERRILSYGMLVHPWLVEREGDGGLVTVPPDGAMIGLIVKRTLARGAWIAPGNEPVRGALGLEPVFDRAEQRRLISAGVNVFSTEPHGLVSLTANTLTADEEFRPLVIRRLLALLRRLALERGQHYAFEPLGETLLRTVQHSFEEMLGRMFAGGAFAGRTRRAAFQVDTGPSVNPPTQFDLGRFVVELRVAPALPLTFITVRLEQAGERGVVTEVE